MRVIFALTVEEDDPLRLLDLQPPDPVLILGAVRGVFSRLRDDLGGQLAPGEPPFDGEKPLRVAGRARDPEARGAAGSPR
jgi:hypothetical protein